MKCLEQLDLPAFDELDFIEAFPVVHEPTCYAFPETVTASETTCTVSVTYAGPETYNGEFYYAQSPLGLVAWGDALRASAGLIGNTLGAIGGGVFAVATGGSGAVLGGAVVFKSAYGAGANFQNLVAAIRDEEAVSQGAFLNDVAELALPGNENVQRAATVADLALDLATLRASRLATSAGRVTRYGNEILEGGSRLGPTFTGNADAYLRGLGAINAADALLHQTPYYDNQCKNK